MNALVVHCKRSPHDVYIGRPTKWGNPFMIGRDGNRTQVVEKYRQYLLSNDDLRAQLTELRGKVLGCWCAPDACHGDVLAEMANGVDESSAAPKQREYKLIEKRPTGNFRWWTPSRFVRSQLQQEFYCIGEDGMRGNLWFPEVPQVAEFARQ